MESLKGKKVAILTDNGFEQSELTEPKAALEQKGVVVHIISPQANTVKAWNKTNWGIELPVDKQIGNVRPQDYDMLVLPGGVMNPDTLRTNMDAVAFAKHFLQEGKPIAAICHGPQLLIETKMLQGRRMTSVAAIKTDLKNAGVKWEDDEVVTDNGLVTSRTPKDLPAFNKKMLEELKEGIHEPA